MRKIIARMGRWLVRQGIKILEIQPRNDWDKSDVQAFNEFKDLERDFEKELQS